MISKILSATRNIPGKRVKGKYIVFESDDWGSIRMPSLSAYQRLKQSGVNLGEGESLRYNISDTLADKEDFSELYSVLSRYRDQKGNHPIFTAISVVANPDFEAIEAQDYQAYLFEPFTKTLKRYGKEDAIDMWRTGISQRLFVPEFHGREHLNVSTWLRALQAKDRDTLLAFKEKCWGIMNHLNHPHGIMYQAAFDLEMYEDIEYQIEVLQSGLKLFEDIHGYKASYFVPPNGPFNNELERVVAEEGVVYIGAAKIQREPLGEGRFRHRLHWLGQRNKHGQYYITRNAFFEPNAPGQDWLATCLADISDAFKWNKPAVISTHRTNYIGSLNKENRNHSLKLLEQLIREVIRRWPDVEFMPSGELGRLISGQDVR